MALRMVYVDREWIARAECKGSDPNDFYLERGASLKEATQICWRCPVREECLEYALRTRQRYGIWGGKSERQRRGLRKTRPEYNRWFDYEIAEEAKRLRSEGVPRQEVASILKISEGTVKNYTNRNGREYQ